MNLYLALALWRAVYAYGTYKSLAGINIITPASS